MYLPGSLPNALEGSLIYCWRFDNVSIVRVEKQLKAEDRCRIGAHYARKYIIPMSTTTEARYVRVLYRDPCRSASFRRLDRNVGISQLPFF